MAVLRISGEMATLVAIREGRATFFRKVVDSASQYRSSSGGDALDMEEVRQLKSEGVAQIAELFFSIDELGLSEPHALRGYLIRHNDDLSRKLEEMRTKKASFTPTGLSRDRIASGILEESQIRTLVEEAEDGRLRFDQSSLACLLVEVMAAESCRKLIVLLSRCGFFRRIGTNNVRIRSERKLEDLYRDHLQLIRKKILEAA